MHVQAGGGERWLLHPDGLVNLGVPAPQCAAICEDLLARGIITRSGNATGTVQERVMDSERLIRKVRFWVLNIEKIRGAE
jgi:hypothetical protein